MIIRMGGREGKTEEEEHKRVGKGPTTRIFSMSAVLRTASVLAGLPTQVRVTDAGSKGCGCGVCWWGSVWSFRQSPL